jgi:hypothetical protein
MKNAILNKHVDNENSQGLIALCSSVATRVFLLGISLLLTSAKADESATNGFRQVRLKMPQTMSEILGLKMYQNRGFGFSCNPGEIVKTCDAETSLSMPKAKMFGNSTLVIGPATNTALLGMKVKTSCKGWLAYDNACVYEGCVGYKKPILMVCVPKGSKQ